MNLLLIVIVPALVLSVVLFIATMASEPCAACGRHRFLRKRLPFGVSLGCTCLVRAPRQG